MEQFGANDNSLSKVVLTEQFGANDSSTKKIALRNNIGTEQPGAFTLVTLTVGQGNNGLISRHFSPFCNRQYADVHGLQWRAC